MIKPMENVVYIFYATAAFFQLWHPSRVSQIPFEKNMLLVSPLYVPHHRSWVV
jgi:hypothetical protein